MQSVSLESEESVVPTYGYAVVDTEGTRRQSGGARGVDPRMLVFEKQKVSYLCRWLR